MNVNLTPELEQIVHRKVESGRYNSASEVVREAVRLMADRDQLRSLHLEEIRNKIAAGVSSARAGRVTDGAAFMARMEAELIADLEVENKFSIDEDSTIS